MNPIAYQVTEWGDPDEMMVTSYGRISYKHWLHCETQRWDAKDLDARNNWLMAHPDGRLAMFTDWPGVKGVGGAE